MSPTATICTVVVALVFFAWLFQSDTKDPGYEAWLKRQQEEKKSEQAQKASLNIAVTDAGVTKDNSPIEPNRDRNKSVGPAAGGGDFVITGDSGLKITDVNPGNTSDPTTRPTQVNGRPGFGASARLHGTYIGVAYVGDVPTAKSAGDAPSITFQRDGNFSTQNMAAAEVDMEPGNAIATPLDRGSGRYKLSGNTLELTYTDGLTRRKGPHRSYTVVPVEGDPNNPSVITIQGKVFKLDTAR
jgi:hypothetical protein